MNIQFACGGNKLEGWINHDSDADIRGRLPYEDGVADWVFIEHGLEHVNSHEGLAFMRECHRILKPGGVLRVCVPELRRLFMTREHMSDLILGHGHQMVYSSDSLAGMLVAAGFDAIWETGRKEIDSHWKTIGREKDDLETLRMEAVK
jgi:predicted SAM-dependent methyltransferase